MKTKKTKKISKREALTVKEYICKRKKKGLYTLVFVTGLPGTGKSYSCIRLGEILSEILDTDKEFTADNIFDDFVKLVKFIKDAKPNEVNIGVIEEVSVLFSSRRSMASENVDINRVLDTARKKQVILLANAPLWPSIDSHMRSLGNLYLETITVNENKKRVIGKPLILQTNPHSGKTYKHTPTYKKRDIHRVWVGKPSEDIIKQYEKRKDEFMDEIYSKAIHKKKQKEEKLKKEMGKTDKNKFSEEELKIWNKRFNEEKTMQDIAFDLGYNSRTTIHNKLKKIKRKLSSDGQENSE